MSKRLRLLLVNAHGADEFAGGAEAYAARLADGFSARGFEVDVLAAFPSETRGRRVTTLHATHWRTNAVRRLRNHAGDVISAPTRRLADVVARVRPDVVHTMNLPGISTAIWEVARRRGIPVAHTILDYQLLCPRVTLLQPDGTPCRPHPLLCGLRRRRLARWSGAVSHVIGVSKFVLDLHAGFFPNATLEKIGLLAFPPRRSIKPPGARLATIGYLGALEHTKGVVQLLEAAPALRRLGVSVALAGAGRLRAEVEAAAAREPNVEYEGTVSGPDKDRFLERCDAGILPSVWQEPGGPTMVALEWLESGRPLLLSPRGGMREALPELPGAVEIEPTGEGITRAVEQLSAAEQWGDAVRRVRAPKDDRDLEAWLDKHESVYANLSARVKR
jgi:glycosyltransferase involved in cell wall biosynthesis